MSDYEIDLAEFAELPLSINPQQLRYLTFRQLSKLNTLELAERRIYFKEVVARCDKKIDKNMDCFGIVCSAKRYEPVPRRRRAVEQIRRIDIILKFRKYQ